MPRGSTTFLRCSIARCGSPTIRNSNMKDRKERFWAVYSALDAMEQELARTPGRKQLLWITNGIPSNMRFSDQGWVDLTPQLRALAAQYTRDNIAIYTLDPSLTLGTLTRDGLEVLSTATGGRTFGSSDLAMALRRAQSDTSTSYWLEYEPPASDNKENKKNY